jgi:hypothetical protein
MRDKQKYIDTCLDNPKMWTVTYSNVKDSFILKDSKSAIEYPYISHLKLHTPEKTFQIEKSLLSVPKKGNELFSKRSYSLHGNPPLKHKPASLQPVPNIQSICLENTENVGSKLTESNMYQSNIFQPHTNCIISTISPPYYNK